MELVYEKFPRLKENEVICIVDRNVGIDHEFYDNPDDAFTRYKEFCTSAPLLHHIIDLTCKLPKGDSAGYIVSKLEKDDPRYIQRNTRSNS